MLKKLKIYIDTSAIGYLDENEEKLNTLLGFIAQIEYETVGITTEAEHIANLVKKGDLLVSDKHQNDRLHIGCAFVTGCDIIVSMNFKHLVNVKTIRGVRAISNIAGYKNMDIIQPKALVDEEGAD